MTNPNTHIDTKQGNISNDKPQYTYRLNKVIQVMTIPNTHIDELNKVIQVMTNPNTHIDELNKVIQAMTNPNAHKMN